MNLYQQPGSSNLGPVVQSAISLTSTHIFQQKFQHICVSLDGNFNEFLTKDIVSFEQLDPDCLPIRSGCGILMTRVRTASAIFEKDKL